MVHPEIVVRGGEAFLRLTGLKQGTTLCAVNHLYIRRRVFQVVVGRVAR